MLRMIPIAVMLFAFCSLVPRQALADGQVGETAPDFTLQNTAGETVEVVFGQGEVFLLAFVGYG